MTYGLPYQGSKNSIAQWVVDHLPPATRLYDLFAGGCAVTHAALLSGKFGEVHANDIQGDVLRLFLDAINGRYRDETRWISRDQFDKMKATDAYVRLCWSFANNGSTYIYSSDSERMISYIWQLMFSSTAEQKFELMQKILCGIRDAYDVQMTVEGLQRMPSFERLRRLQNLENLKKQPVTSAEDYRDVEICSNCTIYCDPPYRNTSGYGDYQFDHEDFYDWALRQTQPIIISELSMPSDFVEIAATCRQAKSSQTVSDKTIERLFVPRHQAAEYRKPGQLF